MRLSALFSLLLAAFLLTACSSDDLGNGKSTDEGQPITISLAIATDDGDTGTASTRRQTRATSWSYEGEDDYSTGEGIYSWFVVMVRPNSDGSGKIEGFFSSDDIDLTATSPNYRDNLKEDEVTGQITTTTGEVIFYNFANISPQEVFDATGNAITSFAEGNPISAEQLAALDNATYGINGNGYDPTAVRTFTYEENGKEKTDHLTGIPMSGRQVEDLTWADNYNQRLTLWVVRMLAKVEMKFTNKTGYDVTIYSADIGTLTANYSRSGEKNIYLLPTYTPNASGLSDPSDATTQKPRIVNLGDDNDLRYIYYGKYESTGITLLSEDNEEITTLENGKTASLTFYVNESDIQLYDLLGFGEFDISAGLIYTDPTTGETVGDDNFRYAIISDNEAGEWSYIARNDYRVIPITLQDYKLELVPYDYPPIGVLPSSVYNDGYMYTVTFHAGGDFHLVPKVTKYSTGETVAVTTSNATWENLYLADQEGNRMVDGNGDPAWSRMYTTTPVWASQWDADAGNTYSETGDYIHGSFQYEIDDIYSTHKSYHRLTIQIAPTDGSVAARTFIAPIILCYQP